MVSPGTDTISYGVDDWGNFTGTSTNGGSNTSYSYAKISGTQVPSTNRLSSLTVNNGAPTNFTFDTAGNMTTAGSTSYQWDAANRLKSVNNGSLGSYGYDGNGKRVKKTESGTTTYYVISSVLGSVMEVTSAGVQRAYVMSGSSVVAQLNPNGQFYWLHLDHLGSGRKMTDSAGNMTYRAEFDPYGKLLFEWSSPTNLNTRKFTGYERDAATNLDYAQARMYGSEWGRFISADKAGMSAVRKNSPKTFNRYAYAGGDPVNNVDPTGETYNDWVNSMVAGICRSQGGQWQFLGFNGLGLPTYGCVGIVGTIIGTIIGNLPTGGSGQQPTPPPILRITGPYTVNTSRQSCGGSLLGIHWQVLNGSNVDGWIIQHVKMDFEVEDENGAPVVSKNNGLTEYEYWEAWAVNKGQVQWRRNGYGNDTDFFTTVEEDMGTLGFHSIKGYAKLMIGTSLDSEIQSWPGVREAKELYATRTRPSWWSDSGTIEHWMKESYDCTNGKQENNPEFSH